MIPTIFMSIIKKIGFSGIVFLFFFIIPKGVFASNVLSNSGFEEGIKDWGFTPSTATFSATADFKHEGSFGVTLSKEDSSSWAY